MAEVKIRATSLPKGDGDGLSPHAGHLIKSPDEPRLMLAVVYVREIVTHTEDGSQTAILAIRRAELVDDPDLAVEAQSLILKVHGARHGEGLLPLGDVTEQFEQYMGGDLLDHAHDDEAADDGAEVEL